MVDSICGCEEGRNRSEWMVICDICATHMRPSSEHDTIREPSLLKCTAVT